MKTISVLRFIQQMIYQFRESTPAHVKYSNRNRLVANAVAAIEELVKDIRDKKKRN